MHMPGTASQCCYPAGFEQEQSRYLQACLDESVWDYDPCSALLAILQTLL